MKDNAVYYSQFGAKGDGEANDFAAIVKCHEYANANGFTVRADAGTTYYIGETDGVEAIVKTDVDWGDATFLIDDSIIPPESPSRNAHIFSVTSDNEIKVFDEKSEIIQRINENGGFIAGKTINVGYAPGYTALLTVYNDNHSAYVRYGVHGTGAHNPLRELVVVDKDGNIDPSTAFLLDYNQVTRIEELRSDDEPLTLRGGRFVTKANAAPPVYTAYCRGILFNRSNVTIKDTVHEIVNEGPIGAPYCGFISWHRANNLLCENLSLQSHKTYKDYEYDESGRVIKIHSYMGSYDVGGSFSTNIYFKNCTQTNFYKYKEKNIAYNAYERWGIMGTNYCKNLTYDSCLFSRLDAHAGVYNVNIKNTTISMIYLIGGGVANIENTTVVAPEDFPLSFLELREDYGSTWKGEIRIKDCEFINWTSRNVCIVRAGWNNWNFGYVTHLPNLVIDNLKIDKPTNLYCFSHLCNDFTETIDQGSLQNGAPNLNPMDISATVVIKNNVANHTYQGSPNSYVNKKIKLIEE
ncbi:MAG: hypothetical protein IJY39_14515 [Clostridia bacterium]|nr:hypothetical protein [Clostridia bacterium]